MTAELKVKVYLLALLLLTGSTYAQDNNCKVFDFNLATSYSTGENVFAYTSNDFNGDGNLDITVVNWEVKTVSVLYGDGAGGFAARKIFPTEIRPAEITSGDLNSDGKIDLIAASFYENKFEILLNNGNGGFLPSIIYTPPTQFPNQGQFYDLKAADFNGDGKLDIVTIQNQSDKKLRFFMGDGQGNLTAGTTLNLLRDDAEIEVGDLNNDNLPDVLFSTGQSGMLGHIGFVFGRQDGNFSSTFGFNITGNPVGFSIKDINNDNKNDFAVAFDNRYAPNQPSLRLWLGNGNGTFTAGTKIDLIYFLSPTDITIGDYNGDGKLDLAAPLSGNLVIVVYGDGNGKFENPKYWATPSGSFSIITDDLNGDQRQDLAVIQQAYTPNNSVSVLINKNNEEFNAPKPVPWGTTYLDAADFNNDGFKDLVSAYKTDGITSEVVIALNDTEGGLLPDQNFATPHYLRAVKIGDFNGDGKKDVVTAHGEVTKKLAVFIGDGTGAMQTPVLNSIDIRFENLIVGDFNSDGKDDVFVTDYNARGYSLLSNGDGSFTIAPNFPVTLQDSRLKLEKGDFNQDNKIDLIISNSSEVKLWLGDGTGQFTQSTNSIPSLADVVTGDFNGDGKLDLAGLAVGEVKGVLGNGNGTFGESFSLTTVVYPARSLISGDFNGDGFDDLAFVINLNNNNRNLVLVPSGGQNPSWGNPSYFSVGGLDGYAASIFKADFNNDGKSDISYNAESSRGVIYNTSGSKPCMSIEDAIVTEGDAEIVIANFTVRLLEASEEDVFISYSLAGQNATIGTDLQNTSGRLKISAGQTTGNIAVTINGDLLDEFDETFVVHLASPSGAVLQKANAVGKIVDNDAEPSLTISDVSMSEGFSWQSFNFKVTLSAPSGKPISFRYSTADGTAIGNNRDYSSANSIRNIPAGTTSDTVSISVLGESTYELDENFFLNLSEPVNVAIKDNQAVGTIINDDQVPFVFANFGSISEGDSGVTVGTVNLQLSNPTYLPVSLNLLTSDGTAIGGKDYKSMDKVVLIPAEQTTATTEIEVLGDTINEPSKHFFLNVYNTVNATVNNPQSQFVIFDDESVSNDFDRDGRTDVVVFRPGNGTWYILYSLNNSFGAVNYGLSSDKPVSGDYNGDGRTDIAVWRPENGTWYTPITNRTQQWGANGDIPVHGDYDNDGKIDVALFRPSTQSWYIQQSSNGAYMFVQWGLPSDTPVPADYDGDGKTDIAVYRPETGSWYILRSSDGGLTAVQFGISSDKPTPADYDGDGKADITVFRDGIWHQLRSSDGNTIAFQWGTTGDKPVPGNYDGDDKTDFAVYRGGVWYIWQSSTNSYVAKQFGLPDDIPIQFVSNN